MPTWTPILTSSGASSRTSCRRWSGSPAASSAGREPGVPSAECSGRPQADAVPGLARGEAGELAAAVPQDGRARGHVLGARVHVAEEALERAPAQRGAAARRVREPADLRDGPRRVVEGQPAHRPLAGGQVVAPVERLLVPLPGL